MPFPFGFPSRPKCCLIDLVWEFASPTENWSPEILARATPQEHGPGATFENWHPSPRSPGPIFLKSFQKSPFPGREAPWGRRRRRGFLKRFQKNRPWGAGGEMPIFESRSRPMLLRGRPGKDFWGPIFYGRRKFPGDEVKSAELWKNGPVVLHMVRRPG